jgi:hypothetical protein
LLWFFIVIKAPATKLDVAPSETNYSANTKFSTGPSKEIDDYGERGDNRKIHYPYGPAREIADYHCLSTGHLTNARIHRAAKFTNGIPARIDHMRLIPSRLNILEVG